MHGAKNLNPVITLKNLLPPGRGPMLRDGPALAIPYRDGETGPATRLWRKTGEQHLIGDSVAISLLPPIPKAEVVASSYTVRFLLSTPHPCCLSYGQVGLGRFSACGTVTAWARTTPDLYIFPATVENSPHTNGHVFPMGWSRLHPGIQRGRSSSCFTKSLGMKSGCHFRR